MMIAAVGQVSVWTNTRDE